MDAVIIHSVFSDHHIITIDINKKTFRSQHFNKKRLYNKLFCESFTHLHIWENWRLQKNNYETKSQWWEVGKVHIKNILQEQVKNALIRSRFCSVKDMDARIILCFI